MKIKAAVSPSLPVSALLGTDAAQLGHLLQLYPLTVHMRGLEQALVTTQAQARQQAEEERKQEIREASSGVKT